MQKQEERMDHKMYDMGEMRNTDCCPSEPGNKKEKYYPSINISSKQLPGLKGKKFGDTIELHLKGKVGGMREDYDDKTEAEYDIKIIEAGMISKMPKEEYEKLSEEEKDKADEKEVMGGKS